MAFARAAYARTAQLVERIPPTKPTHPDGLVLEAWAQGYLVGSLIIMAAITVANMRRKVLLHKLILLELILGTFHGTFIFNNPPVYGWYLSVTAILLNISWSLHNVIAWMKTRPFLSRNWSIFYIATLILAQPYWVVEIYANFTYFNNINDLFEHTRPFEAIFRDPWWIFSVLNLFWNLIRSYRLSVATILYISPRFGVLLVAMFLSLAFIIVDICSVTGVFDQILPDGLNPFWKLAMVFKCLCDSIILDDFKTALDRLMRYKLRRERLGDDSFGPLGPTAGTNDAIREEEEDRMHAHMDPFSEDAAERGKSVTTLVSGAVTPVGNHQSMTLPKIPKPLTRKLDIYDDIDLPEYISPSGSGELKSASGSSSTTMWRTSSLGRDLTEGPNELKKGHDSVIT